MVTDLLWIVIPLFAICLIIDLFKLHKQHKQEEKDFNNGFCPKCGNAFKLLFVDRYDGKRIYGCNKCDNSVFVSFKDIDFWTDKKLDK